MMKKRKKKPLTAAQQLLAASNLGLVGHALKKLPTTFGCREEVDDADLYAEGCAALCNAARLYDSRRGTKFSTYATWAAYNAMLSLLQVAEKHYNRTMQLSDDVLARETVEDSSFATVDERDAFDCLTWPLFAYQRAAVQAVYRDGCSMQEVARRGKYTVAVARKVMMDSRARMREASKS